MAKYTETSDILDEQIPHDSVVVFDWDNTLKLVNRQTRTLQSRVSKQFLEHLKSDKNCTLFVISAISPSKINMETILMEIDRLRLTDVFVNKDASPAINVVSRRYAYKGNVIICGYDKAEVFLEIMSERSKEPGWNSTGDKSVVFFDDEFVNIENFSAIVKNSKCFHIV